MVDLDAQELEEGIRDAGKGKSEVQVGPFGLSAIGPKVDLVHVGRCWRQHRMA